MPRKAEDIRRCDSCQRTLETWERAYCSKCRKAGRYRGHKLLYAKFMNSPERLARIDALTAKVQSELKRLQS